MCDYYTVTDLEITYDDDQLAFINVKMERRYFREYQGDSDESDYESKEKDYYENQLKIKDPIIIYESGKYKNVQCEKKYNDLVFEYIPKDSKIKNITKFVYDTER